MADTARRANRFWNRKPSESLQRRLIFPALATGMLGFAVLSGSRGDWWNALFFGAIGAIGLLPGLIAWRKSDAAADRFEQGLGYVLTPIGVALFAILPWQWGFRFTPIAVVATGTLVMLLKARAASMVSAIESPKGDDQRSAEWDRLGTVTLIPVGLAVGLIALGNLYLFQQDTSGHVSRRWMDVVNDHEYETTDIVVNDRTISIRSESLFRATAVRDEVEVTVTPLWGFATEVSAGSRSYDVRWGNIAGIDAGLPLIVAGMTALFTAWDVAWKRLKSTAPVRRVGARLHRRKEAAP